MESIFAWLFWDPHPDALFVPLIDRPIRWYGIFFVLGFVVGYFIFARMFAQKILATPTVTEKHVQNWSILIQELQKGFEDPQSSFQKIVPYFNSQIRKEIKKWDSNETISPALKESILKSLNDALQNNVIDRETLQNIFPVGIANAKDIANRMTDTLLWFVVAGTLIGARFGEVFFWNWDYYREHPADIIKIWNGGLASHGATLGILLALGAFLHYGRKVLPKLSFIGLVDYVCVPVAFAAVCIRIGNFFNQEIIGNPSTLPWAVIFGHPSDFSTVEPRHPTQLYEAVCYLITFSILIYLWNKKGPAIRTGILTGVFFILVFGTRFLIEFLKVPFTAPVDQTFLQMGQYLSIPFVIWGLWLLYGNARNLNTDEHR